MTETNEADPVETMYALLKTGWTPGNTAGRTPRFYKREIAQRADWRTHDVILIYDKAYTDEDVGIMHAHTTHKHNLSVEVRSPRARRQVKRNKSEVDRLINGWDPITDTSYTEYTDASTNEEADWSYDEILKAGSNIPFDAKDGTRMVLEYVMIKFYKTHHT
jgi:hypothetical protein